MGTIREEVNLARESPSEPSKGEAFSYVTMLQQLTESFHAPQIFKVAAVA